MLLRSAPVSLSTIKPTLSECENFDKTQRKQSHTFTHGTAQSRILAPDRIRQPGAAIAVYNHATFRPVYDMIPLRQLKLILPALAFGWLLGWYSHQWQGQHAVAASSTGTAAPMDASSETYDALAEDNTPVATSRFIPGDNTASTPSPPKDHLSVLMLQDDRPGVLDWLDDWRAKDERIWQQQLTRFKSRLGSWLDEAQYDTVLTWTQVYLDRFYFDADIMQLQAAAQLQRHEILKAIQTLFLQRQRGNDTFASDEVRRQIEELVDDYRSDLQQKRKWLDLQTLYEYLVVVEPNNAGHFLQLAMALVERTDFANARLALNHVYDDPEHGPAARALRNRLDNAIAGEVRIPLQRTDNHFSVDGLLDERQSVTLMIDTGASLSALSRSVFDKARSQSKPSYIGELTVQTANGAVQAPRYRFRSLSLAGITLHDVDMLVMDNLPAGQGLLGMNVLGQFPFRIDQENSILLLNSP
jgi:clan AA aspartic protease (TIGR02281 family)